MLPLAAWSQDDDPGTTDLNLGDLSNPTFVNCSIAGATSSGTSDCTGVVTDDVFYRINVPSQGVKINLSNLTFDGVVEVCDPSLTSVDCANTNIGLGEETLLINNLLPNQDYYIRVHSADGNGGTGDFNLEASYLPRWQLLPNYIGTNGNGELYRVDDQLRRTIDGDIPVEATRWKFRNTVTNETVEYTRAGNFYFMFLDDFEDAIATVDDTYLEYGQSYAVSCQVRIDGFYCGYGPEQVIEFEPEPSTQLLNAYIGGTFDPGNDVIYAAWTHWDQEMEWELSQDGEAISSFTGEIGSRLLFLYDLPDILYDRTYELRIRVTSHGVTGPWSEYYSIHTTGIPYTQLWNSLCDTEVTYSQPMWCTEIPLATGYYWQIAPIQLDDPNFTPIGPAQVAETSQLAINLSEFNLSSGTSYRIAVKPIIANGLQVGDYGYFCQFGTPGSGVGFDIEGEDDVITFNPLIGALDYSQATNLDKPLDLTLSPNPVSDSSVKLSISDNNSNRIQVQVLMATGEILITIDTTADEDILLPANFISELKPGMYSVRVTSFDETVIKRLIVN